MKTTQILFFAVLTFAAQARAQEWEIGGVGGGGVAKSLAVTAPAGAASTGFQSGLAAGLILGNEMHQRVSGEFRYTFAQSNLKLSAGGTSVSFGGFAHAVHYDVLYHARKKGSPMRPFVAAGGGVKVYEGTGKEAAYQPLGSFAYLTHTRQLQPMISAGGGVKFRLSQKMELRTEFRDYITPFPKSVIAPAPGAKISGWVHQLLPMAGVAYTF